MSSIDPPEGDSAPGRLVRATRFAGFVMIVAGVAVLGSYVAAKVWEPLRQVAPWFRHLDAPIQIGLGAATIGAFLLVCSLLWERWQDWRKEKDLPQGRY